MYSLHYHFIGRHSEWRFIVCIVECEPIHNKFSLNAFVSFVQTNFYPNAEISFTNPAYIWDTNRIACTKQCTKQFKFQNEPSLSGKTPIRMQATSLAERILKSNIMLTLYCIFIITAFSIDRSLRQVRLQSLSMLICACVYWMHHFMHVWSNACGRFRISSALDTIYNTFNV